MYFLLIFINLKILWRVLYCLVKSFFIAGQDKIVYKEYNQVQQWLLPLSIRGVTSVSKEKGVAVVTINNWLAKLKEGKI